VHWFGHPGAGNLAPTWFPFRMARLRTASLTAVACPEEPNPTRPHHTKRCGLRRGALNEVSPIRHVGIEPHLSTETRTPRWAQAPKTARRRYRSSSNATVEASSAHGWIQNVSFSNEVAARLVSRCSSFSSTAEIPISAGVTVEQCSAISCHSMLWRDVTLQFVLYFDIVSDVIACT